MVKVHIAVLSPVHLTREEQYQPESYTTGHIIGLSRRLLGQGLRPGSAMVMGRDGGSVTLGRRDGTLERFSPGKLAANRVSDSIHVHKRQDLTFLVGDRCAGRRTTIGAGWSTPEPQHLPGSRRMV